MKLTKHSERNLLVIENFIDNYTSNDDEREQMKQVALSYVSEDHVDGEGSPQAIREIALSSELIRERIDIHQSTNELNVYDIYSNEVTGLIYAVPEDPNETIYIYKLIKPQDVIEVEHRDEILDYCLSKKTPEDEVCLGDIFVHGKYVELISEV